MDKRLLELINKKLNKGTSNGKKKNKKEKEIEQKIKKILEDVEKKTYTKKNLEKMEDFHKKISYV